MWVFNNTYYTMVQLVLMQRAALQLLSRELADYRREVRLKTKAVERHRAARELAEDFSAFRERFYHPQVTPQDQGVDFYAHLQREFEIDRLLEDLEREFSFMTTQGELAANQERADAAMLRARAAGRLNQIVAVALVPTIMTAVYGMNGFGGLRPGPDGSGPELKWSWFIGSMLLAMWFAWETMHALENTEDETDRRVLILILVGLTVLFMGLPLIEALGLR